MHTDEKEVIAGFLFGNYHISYFNKGTTKTFLYSFNYKTSKAEYIDLNMSDITTPTTVGIGIDLNKKLFSVWNDKEIKIQSYAHLANESKGADLSVFEANFQNEYHTDTVSINIGKERFKYGAPKGYIPWSSSSKQCTQKQRMCSFNNLLFFFILISYKI